MKKMRLTLILLIAAFATAFCQPDKTFTEVITFEKGFNFSEGGVIQTMPFTGSSSDVTWETLAGKPLVFPPDLNVTNPLYKSASWLPTWDGILDKPETFPPDMSAVPSVELQAALSELGIYLGKTTAELDAIVPANGFGIAYDRTMGVYKVYMGDKWEILPTTN